MKHLNEGEIAMNVLPTVPDRVIRSYAAQYNLGETDAKQHFAELIRFLSACSSTTDRCAPSIALDKPFHVFFSFGREYREFCLRHFGCFIDHDPSSLEENIGPYLRTRQIAEERFGTLDLLFWPVGADGATRCGAVASAAMTH
jgi:hypothetical protein